MPWTYKAPPAFSDEAFGRWQSLLEERTGISFSLHKSILQAGLYRRMQEIECEDYDEYFHKVQDGAAGFLEWGELLNRITVQETRFFRDDSAFDYVHEYLLQRIPGLVESKGSLEIWSAGCASGEEAYSLAMLAQECIELSGARMYYGVTGTDISNAALIAARSARYRERQLHTVNRALLDRYMNDAGNDTYEVVSTLKERVCFVQSNLVDADEMLGIHMDIIFCQNVLIYFRQSSKRQVLNNLVDHLKPGGILVVGQGEAMGWEHPDVSRVRSNQIDAYIRH